MTDDDGIPHRRNHLRHQSEDGRMFLALPDDFYNFESSDSTYSQRSTPRRRRRRNSGELSLSIQGFGRYDDSAYDDVDDDIPVRDIGLDATWLDRECSNNSTRRRLSLQREGNTEGVEGTEESVSLLTDEEEESAESTDDQLLNCAENRDETSERGGTEGSFNNNSTNIGNVQSNEAADCSSVPPGPHRPSTWCIESPYALRINPQNVDSLLIGARFFNQDEVVTMCKEVLLDCNVENALYYKYIADKHELEDIMPFLMDFVRANFPAISKTHSFLGMGAQQCKILLSDDGLRVDREMEIFYAAREWIDHNKHERLKFMRDIMSCVRFMHCSPEEIARIVEPEAPFFEGPEGRELLLTIYRYHALHGAQCDMRFLQENIPPPRKYIPLGWERQPFRPDQGAFQQPAEVSSQVDFQQRSTTVCTTETSVYRDFANNLVGEAQAHPVNLKVQPRSPRSPDVGVEQSNPETSAIWRSNQQPRYVAAEKRRDHYNVSKNMQAPVQSVERRDNKQSIHLDMQKHQREIYVHLEPDENRSLEILRSQQYAHRSAGQTTQGPEVPSQSWFTSTGSARELDARRDNQGRAKGKTRSRSPGRTQGRNPAQAMQRRQPPEGPPVQKGSPPIGSSGMFFKPKPSRGQQQSSQPHQSPKVQLRARNASSNRQNQNTSRTTPTQPRTPSSYPSVPDHGNAYRNITYTQDGINNRSASDQYKTEALSAQDGIHIRSASPRGRAQAQSVSAQSRTLYQPPSTQFVSTQGINQRQPVSPQGRNHDASVLTQGRTQAVSAPTRGRIQDQSYSYQSSTCNRSPQGGAEARSAYIQHSAQTQSKLLKDSNQTQSKSNQGRTHNLTTSANSIRPEPASRGSQRRNEDARRSPQTYSDSFPLIPKGYSPKASPIKGSPQTDATTSERSFFPTLTRTAGLDILPPDFTADESQSVDTMPDEVPYFYEGYQHVSHLNDLYAPEAEDVTREKIESRSMLSVRSDSCELQSIKESVLERLHSQSSDISKETYYSHEVTKPNDPSRQIEKVACQASSPSRDRRNMATQTFKQAEGKEVPTSDSEHVERRGNRMLLDKKDGSAGVTFSQHDVNYYSQKASDADISSHRSQRDNQSPRSIAKPVVPARRSSATVVETVVERHADTTGLQADRYSREVREETVRTLTETTGFQQGSSAGCAVCHNPPATSPDVRGDPRRHTTATHSRDELPRRDPATRETRKPRPNTDGGRSPRDGAASNKNEIINERPAPQSVPAVPLWRQASPRSTKEDQTACRTPPQPLGSESYHSNNSGINVKQLTKTEFIRTQSTRHEESCEKMEKDILYEQNDGRLGCLSDVQEEVQEPPTVEEAHYYLTVQKVHSPASPSNTSSQEKTGGTSRGSGRISRSFAGSRLENAGNNAESRPGSAMSGVERSGNATTKVHKKEPFKYLRYFQDPLIASRKSRDDTYPPFLYKDHPYSRAGQPPPLPLPPRITTILAVGGLNPTCVDVDVPCRFVEQFNPHMNCWVMLTKLPEPRHHHHCAMLDDYMYLIGGSVVIASDPYNMTNPTDRCYRYDPQGNFWTEISPMHQARMYHSVAVLEGVLYTLGGQTTDETYLETVEYYNADTDAWAFCANLFDKTIGVSAVGFNGLVYAIGGFLEKDDDNIVLGTVECYDPRRNSWMTRHPLPSPRCHAAVTEVGGRIYLLGGATLISEDEPVVSLNSVLRYNEAEDKWDEFDFLRTPRHDVGCCVIGNRIFIVGGVCSTTKDVLSDVECLDVADRYWLDDIDPLSGPVLGLSCVTLKGDMHR